MSAVDHAHNPYAQSRREAKAVRVEAHLRSLAYTAADVEAMPARTRRTVERAAGVRACSDETWELVASLMRSGEAGS